MKQKVVKSEDTIYICGACGFDSEYERDIEKHETKHGRSTPFEVDMEVRYTTQERGSDHGKDYTYGQERTGIIVRFEDHDPSYPDDEQFDDGRYALVESKRGTRRWVGEFELTESNPEENARRKSEKTREATADLVKEFEDANDRRNNHGSGFASYGSTGGFSVSSDF